MGKSMPVIQPNHIYINKDIYQWLDIHFGDTSFNGRVVLGRKKHGGGVLPLKARLLTELRPYILLMHASRQIDYYITANTVSGSDRREDNLFALHNIVIDVDCHDKNMEPAEIQMYVQAFLWRAQRDLWGTGEIPTPNSIVRTGRGVQLWWALKPCYGGTNKKNCRSFYDRFKSVIMDHIEYMLADYAEELEGMQLDRTASKNPVGYYRIPCTYNTKAKRYSTLEILHTQRYDVVELAQQLERPESEIFFETPEEMNIPLQKTDIIVLHNFYSTGLRRVLQLTKLRNLRNNEAGKETRNYFNFAVYNALRMSYEHEEAMERLRAFNTGFKDPMSEKELQGTISSAKKKGGYKYTNAKLIELLGITQEEQDAIGLHPFRGKYRPWTHAKSNASRDAARRAIREDRDNKILSLHQDGVSQAETARQLGVGKNTVGRVLKRLKAEQDEFIASEDTNPNQMRQSGQQEECHQNGAIYELNNSVAYPIVSFEGGQTVYSQYTQPARGLFLLPRKKPPDDS